MDRDFSGWKLIKMESLSLLLCTSPGPRRERGRSEVPQERVQGSRREGGAGPEELKKKVSGNVSGFFFFFKLEEKLGEGREAQAYRGSRALMSLHCLH